MNSLLMRVKIDDFLHPGIQKQWNILTLQEAVYYKNEKFKEK